MKLDGEPLPTELETTVRSPQCQNRQNAFSSHLGGGGQQFRRCRSAEMTLTCRRCVSKHRKSLSPRSTELKDAVERPGVMLQEPVRVPPWRGETISHRHMGISMIPVRKQLVALNESLGHVLDHHLPLPPQSDNSLVYSCTTRKAACSLSIFFWRKRGKNTGDGVFNAFCNLQRSIFIWFRVSYFHCKTV